MVLFSEIIIVSELLEYSLINKKEKNSIKKYLVISVEIIPPVILFILSNTIGKFIFMILIFALLFIKNKKRIAQKSKKMIRLKVVKMVT